MLRDNVFLRSTENFFGNSFLFLYDTILAFLFQLQARLDNAEDTILVDTPLDIDPRTKNKKSEDKSEEKEVEEVVKKNEKISPDEFGKNEVTLS